MKPEQKIIAAWVERVRESKGLNWSSWAKKVKASGVGTISATTISRAVDDDYQSVSSIETLHMLARAAEVPSVLDFLEGRVFSVAAMKAVLTDLLQLSPKGGWSERDVERLAEALEYGLGLPPIDPANPASAGAYATAARAAVDRFLASSDQS